MEHVERDIENECCMIARRHGWVAVKLEKNGHKGIPDRIFLHPSGVFRLVEFKKDAKMRLKTEQNTWKNRFFDHFFVVFSVEQFVLLNWDIAENEQDGKC